MERPTLLVLAIVALWALPAGAGDVVHLKKGGEVAGKVTDGLLEVRVVTADGEVRVPWSRIDRIDRADYVRELYDARREKVAEKDAADWFELALWCRRNGLADEMKSSLRKVLSLDPDHKAARAAMGYEKVGEAWVAGDEALAAKGFVKRGDRWILKEEAEYERMAKIRDRAFREEEVKAADLIEKAADENPRVAKYAKTAFRALPWQDVRLPLYRSLGDKSAGIRAFAAAQLGEIGEVEAMRPLIRTAVLDTSPAVREAAVGAVASFGRPEALFPFVRALASPYQKVRMNAAQAIGGLGQIRGVEYLVSRLKQNWGSTQRNNIQVMRQVSYIQDFDVEIAQLAQIGDPIVGVLREGVVLDYRVYGVDRTLDLVERRVIYGALARLSGKDLGEDSVAWEKWWAANREELLAQAD